VGVGVGVGVVDGGGLDGVLEAGGAVLGGAEPVGGVAVEPPCRVTTTPPGAKVTVLVHCPAGAALVAVAVTAADRPGASVPEL
jgi:hypothetical protein